MNWTKREWKNATKWMTRKDGTRFSAGELKAEFIKMLGEGKKVIPIGECDNFDFETGCKGHPITEEAA